jgi:hypothetical protein
MKTSQQVALWAPAVLGAALFLSARQRAEAAPGDSPAASASASAAPAASGSAAAPSKPTIASYAWPTEASDEPKEPEWANATELEPAKVTFQYNDGTCTQKVVREWVRLRCAPASEDVFLGPMWALAGDFEKVKGGFALAASRTKTPPQSPMDMAILKMGIAGELTFQARPGKAFVVSMDRMGFDEGWDGATPFVGTGLLIDVSWAPGEKAPTIVYR